jgi:hypothetical protein
MGQLMGMMDRWDDLGERIDKALMTLATCNYSNPKERKRLDDKIKGVRQAQALFAEHYDEAMCHERYTAQWSMLIGALAAREDHVTGGTRQGVTLVKDYMCERIYN